MPTKCSLHLLCSPQRKWYRVGHSLHSNWLLFHHKYRRTAIKKKTNGLKKKFLDVNTNVSTNFCDRCASLRTALSVYPPNGFFEFRGLRKRTVLYIYRCKPEFIKTFFFTKKKNRKYTHKEQFFRLISWCILHKLVYEN